MCPIVICSMLFKFFLYIFICIQIYYIYMFYILICDGILSFSVFFFFNIKILKINTYRKKCNEVHLVSNKFLFIGCNQIETE